MLSPARGNVNGSTRNLRGGSVATSSTTTYGSSAHTVKWRYSGASTMVVSAPGAWLLQRLLKLVDDRGNARARSSRPSSGLGKEVDEGVAVHVVAACVARGSRAGDVAGLRVRSRRYAASSWRRPTSTSTPARSAACRVRGAAESLGVRRGEMPRNQCRRRPYPRLTRSSLILNPPAGTNVSQHRTSGSRSGLRPQSGSRRSRRSRRSILFSVVSAGMSRPREPSPVMRSRRGGAPAPGLPRPSAPRRPPRSPGGRRARLMSHIARRHQGDGNGAAGGRACSASREVAVLDARLDTGEKVVDALVISMLRRAEARLEPGVAPRGDR